MKIPTKVYTVKVASAPSVEGRTDKDFNPTLCNTANAEWHRANKTPVEIPSMWDYSPYGIQQYEHMKDLLNGVSDELLPKLVGIHPEQTVQVQKDDLLSMIEAGVKHEILKVQEMTLLLDNEMDANDPQEFVTVHYEQLVKLNDRYHEQLTRIAENAMNNKVNVHASNGSLTEYTRLQLMEDACTDALQIELNDGWRILAVCVQPDQRRPDYILGKLR